MARLIPMLALRTGGLFFRCVLRSRVVLVTWILTAILAAPASAQDSDSDGLLDIWEIAGLDVDHDGTVDVDFPAMGADPRRKDVFIECDFMTLDVNGDGDTVDAGEHTHQPLAGAVQDVIDAFAAAPVSNPDGSRGITAHIDTGNLGGGNAIPHFYEVDFSGRTDGDRFNPAIATAPNGNQLVLVWEDDRDRNGKTQIYAQRITGAGIRNGNEMTVNSNSAGQQRLPSVGMDAVGRFVVVWEDDRDGNGKYQILARGFNAGGGQRFAETTVNSVAAGQQLQPDIALNPATGNFVVVWADDQDGNGKYQILARGFDINGNQRFADITVNSVAAGQQQRPVVAIDSSDRFLVAWEDDQDGNGTYQILARGFNANGTVRIADFTVNSVSAGQQLRPDVAMDDPGNFIVTWQDDQDDNGKYQILARGFDANGTERIPDFTVNSIAAGQQLEPAIGADRASGGFVISWSDDQDGNGKYQILARGFDANGNEAFSDRTINQVAAGDQLDSSVAMDSTGNATFAWEDDRDSSVEFEVFVRQLTVAGGPGFAELRGHGRGTRQDFYDIRAANFSPDRRGTFHYCLFAHNRLFTTSSGIGEIHGDDFIVSLGSFSALVGSRSQQANTLMHELGHNLDLRHGGFENRNNKPNYNSIMNYDYQFPGVDTNCDAVGDGVLDYSPGALPQLDEAALNELAGMCTADIKVNAVSAGQQVRPRSAGAANGDFVVVWEDDQDGNGKYQILMRGFDGTGAPRFAGTVNSVAAGQQYRPAVAMNGNSGNFVVVWEDDQDGNGKYQILARGFNANGSQRFGDITVNSVAAGQQLRPSVAMDASDRFIVVWQDDQDGNGKYQILGRGFNANGTQRIADFTVNSVSAGQQLWPSVAADTTGRFVVAWQDDQDGNGKYQILARGFNANGTQRIPDFTVNSVAAGQQLVPVAATNAATGAFVIAWQDDQDGNGKYQILARGFNVNGGQQIADFTVNSVAAGQQIAPGIVFDNGGGFLVSWEDDRDGNGKYEIFARGFSGVGGALSADYRVNGDSSGQQVAPAVGVSGPGNLVVAWEDDADGNGFWEIRARILSPLGVGPASVSTDWDGDGTLEQNLSFDVNGDGSISLLKDFNDWGGLKLDF